MRLLLDTHIFTLARNIGTLKLQLEPDKEGRNPFDARRQL